MANPFDDLDGRQDIPRITVSPSSPQANPFDDLDVWNDAGVVDHTVAKATRFAKGGADVVGGGLSGIAALVPEDEGNAYRQLAGKYILEGKTFDEARNLANAELEAGRLKPRKPEETMLGQAGAGITNFANKSLDAGPLGEGIVGDVAGAAGSMVGGLAVAAVPGVGPTMAGGLFIGGGANEARERAIQSGATPEQVNEATKFGATPGAMDLVDIALPKLFRGKSSSALNRALKGLITGGFIEGSQEGIQQAAQNLVAKGIYDPNADVMKDVGYSALIGALTGGPVKGTIDVLQGPEAKPYDPKAPVVQEYAPAKPVTVEDNLNNIFKELGLKTIGGAETGVPTELPPDQTEIERLAGILGSAPVGAPPVAGEAPTPAAPVQAPTGEPPATTAPVPVRPETPGGGPVGTDTTPSGVPLPEDPKVVQGRIAADLKQFAIDAGMMPGPAPVVPPAPLIPGENVPPNLRKYGIEKGLVSPPPAGFVEPPPEVAPPPAAPPAFRPSSTTVITINGKTTHLLNGKPYSPISPDEFATRNPKNRKPPEALFEDTNEPSNVKSFSSMFSRKNKAKNQQIRAMVGEPTNDPVERASQSIPSWEKPEDVVWSEPVWGTARVYSEQSGVPFLQAFKMVANGVLRSRGAPVMNEEQWVEVQSQARDMGYLGVQLTAVEGGKPGKAQLDLIENALSLISGPMRNQWIELPEGQMYLRRSRHPELGQGEWLDVANIVFEEEFQGKGAFTRYLQAMEIKAFEKGYNGVYVENLLNQRLLDFLQRNGYSVVRSLGGFDSGPPSVVKNFVKEPDSVAPQFQGMMRPGMTEVQAQTSTDAARLAMILGPALYGEKKNQAEITMKELFQNSVDGVRAELAENEDFTEGRITISADMKKRTITIHDNGIGMLPGEISTKFLRIAGTGKDDLNNAGGGFGIAKLVFLYGANRVRIMTMRNARVSMMSTTGDELMASLGDATKNPQIQTWSATTEDFKMFPDGHGTVVSVEIPQSYKNPSTGKVEEIYMWDSIHDYGVLNGSPLFLPITVVYNGGEVGTTGVTFPFNDYTTFANVEFEWGTARVYVSKKEKKYPEYGTNVHVSSNGIWQFDTMIRASENGGAVVQRSFYVDVIPKVKPTEDGYPFHLNRQAFSEQTRKDFSEIFKFVRVKYQQKEYEDDVQNFGTFSYMDVDPVDGPRPGDEVKITIPRSKSPANGVQEGDTISVVKGQMVINGRATPTLSKTDLAATKIDLKSIVVDQRTIDSNKIILHDNTSVTISALDKKSASAMAADKFGQRFFNWVYQTGELMLELRAVVAEMMPENAGIMNEALGISFDWRYRGVSIRTPFKGTFLNIAFPIYDDPTRAGGGLVSTIIHEFAHHLHRNHEAGFRDEMVKIQLNLEAHPTFDFYEFKYRMAKVVQEHHDIMMYVKGLPDVFPVAARGRNLEDFSADATRNGSDIADVVANGSGPGGFTALFSRVSTGPGTPPAEQHDAGVLDVSISDADSVRAGQQFNQRVHTAESATLTGTAVPIQPETQQARAALQAVFKNAGGVTNPTKRRRQKARPLTPGQVARAAAPSTPGQPPVGGGGQSGGPPNTTTTGPGAASGPPPGVQQQAAHADKINWLYKWMAGLDQLVSANPLFRPLIAYWEKIVAMHSEEAKIQDAALRIAKKWRALGAQGENLTALIDDVTNMVYRTPREIANKVERHPTQQEFAALVAKHQVNTEAQQVYTLINKAFDGFLQVTSQVAIDETIRHISDPQKRLKRITQIQNSVAQIRSKPYFPFMRYGLHYVMVKDANGKIVQFETFERRGLISAERQQMRAAEEARKNVLPGETVTHSILPEESGPLIGMPAHLLQSLKVGSILTQGQLSTIQGLVNSSAQGFASRFRNRAPVKGYSMDFKRSFSRYFFHGAKYYSHTKWAWQLKGDIELARAQLNDNKASKIADYMEDHLKNTVLDAKSDFGYFKGGIFLWAMGYVPAAATQNLTQTPMITFPFLGAKFGDVKATAAISKAMFQLENFYKKGAYDNQTAPEMKAIEYGIKTGRISETQAPELAGMAQGQNLMDGYGGNIAQRHWQSFMEKASWMFEMAEQFNRRIAWRAAYDLALNNPKSKVVQLAMNKYADEYQTLLATFPANEAAAIITAVHTVEQTQYVYARYARPRFMRGRIAGTVFVFRKYMQSTLFMLGQNPDVMWRYMLIAILLGGMGGIPGSDDLKEIVKGLGRWLFGKDWDVDREVRKYVLQFSDGTVPPDIILHGMARRGFGVPALLDLIGSFATGRPGKGLGYGDPDPTSPTHANVPFPVVDRSRAITMGNILPFELGKMLGPTKDENSVIGEQVQKASGAVFSVAFNMYKAMMDNEKSVFDPKRWEKAVPRLLGTASKAFRAFDEGRERSSGGVNSAPTLIPYDTRDPEQLMEILAIGMGYNTLRTQSKWDYVIATQEVTKYYDLQRSGLMEQYFEAVKGGKPEELDRVRKAIVKFNTTLPEMARGKVINSDALTTSMRTREKERLARESGIPSRRSDIPIARGMQQLFPEATIDVRRVR